MTRTSKIEIPDIVPSNHLAKMLSFRHSYQSVYGSNIRHFTLDKLASNGEKMFYGYGDDREEIYDGKAMLFNGGRVNSDVLDLCFNSHPMRYSPGKGKEVKVISYKPGAVTMLSDSGNSRLEKFQWGISDLAKERANISSYQLSLGVIIIETRYPQRYNLGREIIKIAIKCFGEPL